jgi:hypothetical protein
MPTGYTSKLYEGEDQSFEDFVLNCARAFGALIELRDEPDAEIPDTFEPSPYHDKEREKAEAELRELKRLSPVEIRTRAAKDYQAAVRRYREAIADAQELAERYGTMLARVMVWEPPSPDHEALKKFMIDQLQESIRRDCSTKYLTKPEPQPAQEWYDERVKSIMDGINYHNEQQAKEETRAEERNEWVSQLRGALEGVTISE